MLPESESDCGGGEEIRGKWRRGVRCIISQHPYGLTMSRCIHFYYRSMFWITCLSHPVPEHQRSLSQHALTDTHLEGWEGLD